MECHDMLMFDPSKLTPMILNPAKLAMIFKSKDPPVIAMVKKVITTAADRNTILRIYVCRSDSSVEVIPPGTLFGICQIKTISSQAVFDFLISEDYMPLKPVWFTEHCKQMIDEHRTLVHNEIKLLASLTLKN